MTCDFPSRHLKSQIVKTPRPFLLTAAIISSTPSHYLDYITNHLIDIYNPRNTALFAIRKAVSCLNTLERNIKNQEGSLRRNSVNVLTDMPNNISLSTREQIMIINLIWNLLMTQ